MGSQSEGPSPEHSPGHLEEPETGLDTICQEGKQTRVTASRDPTVSSKKEESTRLNAQAAEQVLQRAQNTKPQERLHFHVTSDNEITPREEQIIDDRIDEINDEDKQYTTEEVAEHLDIDLDDE